MGRTTKIILFSILVILAAFFWYMIYVRVAIGDVPQVIYNDTDSEVAYKLFYADSLGGYAVTRPMTISPQEKQWSYFGVCVIISSTSSQKFLKLNYPTYTEKTYFVGGRNWKMHIPMYSISKLSDPCHEAELN